MSLKRVPFILTGILITALCFGGAVYLDYVLKNKALHTLVDENTEKFASMVLEINSEVYQVLDKLKAPAHCDKKVFEGLIYEYKHIKNIGVIQNDTVVCDVYGGALVNKKLEDYGTFEYDEGGVFKYWMRDDYISVVDPRGYFIEYDMNYYTLFDVDDEISGFIILGRQSDDLWFSKEQHPLTQEDVNLVKREVFSSFMKFNHSKQPWTSTVQQGNVIYKLYAADDGSIVATYIHQDYLEPFKVVSFTHIMSGLVVGMLLSYFIFNYYLKQRTLRRILKKAIRNKDFHMVYQPLNDLRHTPPSIVGVEALVRWQLKNGDYIRPDVFIPIAEEAGLTKALTQCLIDKLFEDLHVYLREHPDRYVSINVTPSDLEDDFLVQHILHLLKLYHLRPNQIVIELTERVIANEGSTTGIEAIQNAGMLISIDDFGTGASNVHYLGKWNPDVVKVDRSFVVWSDGDGPTSTLLEKMIAMGKDFGVKVVVEGVETKEQAQRCQQLGADVGQGYYWSKPMTIKELLLLEAEPTQASQ